jgi:PEP-CTERM motif
MSRKYLIGALVLAALFICQPASADPANMCMAAGIGARIGIGCDVNPAHFSLTAFDGKDFSLTLDRNSRINNFIADSKSREFETSEGFFGVLSELHPTHHQTGDFRFSVHNFGDDIHFHFSPDGRLEDWRRESNNFHSEAWCPSDPKNPQPNADPPATPEPGTFILFASGLLGMLLLFYKKSAN